MSSYFFRVEHDLLRSEAFKSLGGSAVKVYLVLGLYSDFGTDWAYPSVRTIARQAGLSRQTVLTAIDQLVEAGLLATTKSVGRSTAYRLMRPAPARPPRTSQSRKTTGNPATDPISFLVSENTGQKSLVDDQDSGPEAGPLAVQNARASGLGSGPKRETSPRENTTTSIPLAGTPFRVTATGLEAAVSDLQEVFRTLGITERIASQLLERYREPDLARILLNALYLREQGKLRNGAGYVRTAMEEGYDLLPQVASRLESRRRELLAIQEQTRMALERARAQQLQEEEQTAIQYVLERLRPEELEELVEQALKTLPDGIARRNPTLSNPFVRAKVYELACGEPSA